MIYAHDHLVWNKNKDDAHRSNHGNAVDSSHEISIWRRSKAIEYSGEIEYVGCCNVCLLLCIIFFSFLCCRHQHLRTNFASPERRIKRRNILRERKRDAKRSHKNENENSIRQIKHKPKCPRELIILFYFVKSVLFLANRENEPNVYNCKTWRSFSAAATAAAVAVASSLRTYRECFGICLVAEIY